METQKVKTEQSALMNQFKAIKEKHTDALVLLRVNDFYESFHEDAITISKILGIVLAKRDDKTAVTGFPIHALDTYLPKLVRAGKRVAICEQLEEPVIKSKVDLRDYQFHTSLTENTRTDQDAKKAVDILNKEANPNFKHIAVKSVNSGIYHIYARSSNPDFVDAVEEPKAGYQTLNYIDKVIADMEKLRHAFYRLSETWARDDKFGIDLNEYMHEKYPFQYSLDDLAFKVKEWEEDSASKLIKLRKSLEPNLADRNNMGEPSAPYFTKAEAEGKWIMAFDTIMQGWSCTTDGENKPYLYNSKEEVEADDMFNPDEDFAILATEYLEGRKLIFGGKGARTEGVSIVKAE